MVLLEDIDQVINKTDQLKDLNCASTEIVAWSNSGWTCKNDSDQYEANTDKLSELKNSPSSCSDGDIIKDPTLLSGVDKDRGSEIELAQSCPDGEEACIINNYGHWQWRVASLAAHNSPPLGLREV